MKNIFFAIFTIITNSNHNNKQIEKLFTKYTKFSQQGLNLVYNVSGSEHKFNTIIGAILEEHLISTINSFKIYFYYPSCGFKVFIIKSENIATIKDSDLYFLKSEMKKYN